MQRRLKGHVDFVRGEHVVLFGRESRKKSLFTSLEVDCLETGEQTYGGHNWSWYARTIEKLIRTCTTITISPVAVIVERHVMG